MNRKIEDFRTYQFIESQFDVWDFDAEEVIESCLEHDMPRLDAVVQVAHYIKQNGLDATFKIDCADAERFFRPDGTIREQLYVDNLTCINSTNMVVYARGVRVCI